MFICKKLILWTIGFSPLSPHFSLVTYIIPTLRWSTAFLSLNVNFGVLLHAWWCSALSNNGWFPERDCKFLVLFLVKGITFWREAWIELTGSKAKSVLPCATSKKYFVVVDRWGEEGEAVKTDFPFIIKTLMIVEKHKETNTHTCFIEMQFLKPTFQSCPSPTNNRNMGLFFFLKRENFSFS